MTQTAAALIRFYQALDAAKHQLLFTVFGFSSVCKHRPTCSQYALMQIKEHGTIWGSCKAFFRLVRCW